MSFVESSSAPDLSNSSVTESTFATVDLTYIIIYSTTTTIGLISTWLDGPPLLPIELAMMTLLDQATR
jgi:hypothetical protein